MDEVIIVVIVVLNKAVAFFIVKKLNGSSIGMHNKKVWAPLGGAGKCVHYKTADEKVNVYR